MSVQKQLDNGARLKRSDWERLRKKAIKRDQARCRECSVTEKVRTLEVHHIVPIAEGGSNTLPNLATLCTECHTRTHRHVEAHSVLNETDIDEENLNEFIDNLKQSQQYDDSTHAKIGRLEERVKQLQNQDLRDRVEQQKSELQFYKNEVDRLKEERNRARKENDRLEKIVGYEDKKAKKWDDASLLQRIKWWFTGFTLN